jgi:hypothetical protein
MVSTATSSLSAREFVDSLPHEFKVAVFEELVKDQIGSNVVWPYIPTMPKHPLRPDLPPPTTAADIDRIERVFENPGRFIDMEAFFNSPDDPTQG